MINFSSDEKIIQKELQIKLLENGIGKIDVKFEGPEFIKFENQIEENILQTEFEFLEKSLVNMKEKFS